MPLGNLTSQIFANIYLHELDYFVKHELKVKYYVRYVDDFVLLHQSRRQLEQWRKAINIFLKKKLKLELHPQKTQIIPLFRGVDFLGFRNFYHHQILRKRNLKNMQQKIKLFEEKEIGFRSIMESYQGWQAYAKWANTFEIRKEVKSKIINTILSKV
ncbi:MAG: RNA-directed DNA polymerase [Nanoarchaeota archaeon]